MKNILLALLFINSFCSLSQINEDLTSEERAYLFHIVKKSPILENNFGRYFDYKGPNIVFPNGEQNYDSIELLIINQPDLLIIRKDEIAKSSKGLIAEASNKMALWELNKVLLAKRDSPNDLKEYQNEYAVFEKLLLERLPPSALKEKDGTEQPQPKLFNVLNPSLSFEDKLAMIESLRFLSINDQLVTLEAMNYAVNRYTEIRTLEIYRSLGGKTESFHNLLTSAGDGSSTTGMLEEREKDEKGRWNKGLPKAVGLFPYDLRIERTEEKKKITEKIEPMRYTQHSFKTVGQNEFTNVHFDVWGYNSSSQTTVVLEKNGLSYPLFGSGETRFLSPDSTFSTGKTFQSIINDLEFNKIGNLNEMIYGKKGFDYWIEYNEKKRDQTELKIVKKEKEYSDMGYSPITTSNKPSRAVKKSKKKAIKSGAGGFNGKPTTSSNRKNRKKMQNGIVSLYDTFEAYKRRIVELEQQKQEAVDLIAIYQLKLDLYKELIGRHWAKYTEKDGLYLFQDSSTFDILTQDFQFKPTQESEGFELRLIAIPMSSLSNSADEVMLHASVMDAEPNYDARINIGLEDIFASDKWELPTRLFGKEDSVALRVFFEGLLDKQVDFSIIARGQGIGAWDGNRTIKDDHPVELASYPGNSSVSKMDSTFVRLRKSELLIRMNRTIELEINSFTDPVASSLSEKNETLLAGMSKYGLTKNDILSAHRTYSILTALKAEISELAGEYLSREQAKIVIDRFNREWEKTKISVGRTSFKLESFR